MSRIRPLVPWQVWRAAACACWPAVLAAVALALLGGCSTVAQRAASSVVGVASLTPNADIQQTYYLGSFDPTSQLPPAVYRIRVSGQSSILNRTRFASGWYPAGLVDALNGNLSIDTKNGNVSSSGAQDSASVLEGRGMVMFGPEGMRDAPRNHRLVVIMGSSPEQVEQAFSSALRSVATVRFGQSGAALDRQLFTRLTQLAAERDQLKAIRDER
jgi:hypothetical protein